MSWITERFGEQKKAAEEERKRVQEMLEQRDQPTHAVPKLWHDVVAALESDVREFNANSRRRAVVHKAATIVAVYWEGDISGLVTVEMDHVHNVLHYTRPVPEQEPGVTGRGEYHIKLGENRGAYLWGHHPDGTIGEVTPAQMSQALLESVLFD